MISEPVLAECLASAALMFCVWYFGFRRIKNDDFRSDIRRLRDNLFDFMVKNQLDFDDEAYRKTRELLNGILRMSNIMDPVAFVILTVAARDSSSKCGLRTLTEKAPDALRQKLMDTQRDAVKKFVIHICSGVIGFIVLTPVSILLTMRNICLKVAGPWLKPETWVESKTESFVPEFMNAGSEHPSRMWTKAHRLEDERLIHVA